MCKTPSEGTTCLRGPRLGLRPVLASRAMDAAPRSALPGGRSAEAALLVALAALLATAVFHGGGSRVDELVSVGIAALVVAGLAYGAALRGALPLPRLERGAAAGVAGAVALTLWAGVSIAWSIAGDLSWDWLGRGLVYLAFLGLGLLAGAVATGARRLAGVLALVVGAAVGWALLGVAIPSLFSDGGALAVLLTQSRAGVVGALAVIALWLLLSRERLADALRIVIAAGPAL